MIKGDNTKSQAVRKKQVWRAYLAICKNGKSAGVDKVSLDEFKKDDLRHLYKLWNRMASGSYFPLPVREVEIPKKDGGKRKLGIPAVIDRVAQMVVKMHLEVMIEPYFHEDSYGYRNGKSAHQALDKAKERCWRYPWVIDLDIKGFFDSIDHELLMRAVRKHCKDKWALLYIERWLKADVMKKDGTMQKREKGTPQGGVISPLLANLFLHYAFDEWIKRNHPGIKFERYADDIIVHCRSRKEAESLQKGIKVRLGKCNLEIHPEKTKIVYCKEGGRDEDYEVVSFTFLGYTFQPRRIFCKDGRIRVGYMPAISKASMKKIAKEISDMRIQRKTDDSIEDIAELLNAKLNGWINYFGRYSRYKLLPIMRGLNLRLLKWVSNKYKQYRASLRNAQRRLRLFYQNNPDLFAHWRHGFAP